MGKKTTHSQLWIVLALVALLPASALGQTSASLGGTVHDQQGAAVPGATVKALDTRTNQEFETITGGEGAFSFPTLQPGTYTVTVELTGFKKLVKSGVILNVADRQTTGTLVLEIGGVSDTVSITAEASQLQVKTTSGEIGEAVTGRQVQELALNGRNYLDLLKIIPGVVSTVNGQVAGPGGLGNISVNGTRMNQHNLTIDGSTNVDTGSNGTQHVMLNLDAIAEFKVLTSNYQAEYGRSAGGDIKILTRGGGSDFHGTGYIFHRHEGLNANTLYNNADGIQRSLYRYNYFGYNVGGPIVLPKDKLKDKLFFFWGQEWHRQLVPTNPRQVRMPTALELAGDFSATRDGNGVPIFIKDPLLSGTCSSTNQTACFPGNRIPASRFNSSGVAVLKLFNKYENSAGLLPLYNHNSQESSGYPRRQENIRIDYRLANHTTIFGRFTQDTDVQILPYGVGWTSGQNFPLTPTLFQQGPARNASLNITSNISPTLVNEFIFGPSQNNLTLDPVDGNAATMSGIGLTFKPPYPYNASQFVNLTFDGIPNQTFGAINAYSQFPYKNSNTTFDFIDSVSKVWRKHVLKVGVFVQRSRKDQAAGGSMTINFSHNVNNPNNAQHPYANALLGNFNTLSEPNKDIFQGQYRNTNLEWFFQDNFKLTRKLTLDYGMRFYIIQPQYDQRLQAGYFNPALWNPAKAVRLYMPGPGGAAIDPQNPSATLPSYLVGRIVPGSGDPFNGMGYAGAGYLRGGIENRGVHYGPRFGFAYDVFGTAKTVVRGGYGLFYDRTSGNALAFPAVGQPPFIVTPTYNWGNLDTVGTSTGEVALSPFGAFGVDPAGHVPTVHNYSLQIQQDLGFDTVLSVGYIASISSHLSQRRNINYIPLGTLFKKEAQDPTRFTGGVVPDSDSTIPQIYKDLGYKFDGSKALQSQFLRPYPGYNAINFLEGSGSANYHSMQVSLNRKFTRSLTYAVAYTWGRTMDTANGDTDTSSVPTDIRRADYRRASFDRRHIMAINYIWNMPRLSPKLGNNMIAKAVFDDWELSGISQFVSGSPAELGFGLQPATGRSLNGSPDYPTRFLLTGDPTGPRSREQWFDPTVLRLPDIGSDGFGPRNYLSNPGLNLHDISIFKNFPYGGGDSSRRIQIRFEMFNAFNHPSFSGFNGGLTWNLATDWSDYKAKQGYDPSWVRNTRTGVNPATGRLGRALGEVNGLQGSGSNRVIQLAAKLYF